MPGVYEAGRNIGSSAEQEAGEICDGFVMQNIDCREDDEADERYAQRAADVECSLAEVVGTVRDAEQYDKPYRIWSHRPEIGLDD